MVRVFLLFVFLLSNSLFSETDSLYHFRIHLGYGLHGSGNIINSSGEGLQLIENGINSGYLYSPIWSPLIEVYGPVYKNQDFDLSSYSIDLQILKKLQKFEYGLSVNYFELNFTTYLPETYLNLSKIIPNTKEYLPVTKELNSKTSLTSVIQFDFFYNYYIWQYQKLIFFVGAGIGFGYGKLAYSGPYVQEVHAIANLGGQYNLTVYTFVLNIKLTGHTAKSGPSNFIDRRKVLVNPRRGEILIATLQLGLSFPLTF